MKFTVYSTSHENDFPKGYEVKPHEREFRTLEELIGFVRECGQGVIIWPEATLYQKRVMPGATEPLLEIYDDHHS